MRKLLGPFFSVFMLAVLAGCQGAMAPQMAANPEATDWCADFYDLTPGTESYNRCVQNGGEPMKDPLPD